MISKEVYLKALSIVEAYHDQVRLEVLEIKTIEEKPKELKPNLRDLDYVEQGDFVKSVLVHAASSFTKDKDYEVLRTNDWQFEIMNDNGKKKWIGKSNLHFKLI